MRFHPVLYCRIEVSLRNTGFVCFLKITYSRLGVTFIIFYGFTIFYQIKLYSFVPILRLIVFRNCRIILSQTTILRDVLYGHRFQINENTLFQFTAIVCNRYLGSCTAYPGMQLHALFIDSDQFTVILLPHYGEMTEHLTVLSHISNIPSKANR